MMRTVVVVNITELYNRRNHQHYMSIEMVDHNTGEYLETYVTPEYRNYANWRKTIDAYSTTNSPVLVADFKLKKGVTDRGAIIVDADSKPTIVSSVDREEYLNVWADVYIKEAPILG